jgi:diguanylate cyclase (GGDEF)-like protein/PAS domain S-box-containing protein
MGMWPQVRDRKGGEAPAAAPGELLPRLRRLFALFTVVAAFAGLIRVVYLAPPRPVLSVLAFVGLGAWAVAMERTRAPWWLDLGVVAPLGLLSLVALDWQAAYPVIHIVLFQRALSGGPLRTYGGAAAVVTVWILVGAWAAGDPLVFAHVGLLIGALLSTALLRQVRLSAERSERAGLRERRLLAASQQMAAALDRRTVDEAVVAAAHELTGQPEARCVLWEEAGESWTAIASVGPSRLEEAPKARLPQDMVGRAEIGEPWVLTQEEATALQASYGLEPRFKSFVFVPLPRHQGVKVVLALSCVEPPDRELPDVLRRFVHEVSLAEDRTRLLAEVEEREARLDSLLQGSIDIIGMLDDDGIITFINRAAKTVHGYEPEDLVGTSVFDLFHKDDRGFVLRAALSGDLKMGVRVAHRLYDVTGGLRHVETNVSRPAGKNSGYILNVRDVTERKALEAEIVHYAHHDALTGLANRRAFTERLEEALARSGRTGVPVGLIVLDLDDFKPVNDTHGHQAGDEVLVAFAGRLSDGIRTTDLAARIGGDEFAVIVEDGGDGEEVSALARRLDDAIRAPIAIRPGVECRIRASMGLASSRAGGDADELLREADQHLYVGKRSRQEAAVRAEVSREVAEGRAPV